MLSGLGWPVVSAYHEQGPSSVVSGPGIRGHRSPRHYPAPADPDTASSRLPPGSASPTASSIPHPPPLGPVTVNPTLLCPHLVRCKQGGRREQQSPAGTHLGSGGWHGHGDSPPGTPGTPGVLGTTFRLL